MNMRPSAYFGMLIAIAMVTGVLLSAQVKDRRELWQASWLASRTAVEAFGLSDLALTTEARYTRHPAVSDRLAPFMDHPGGLEHFPSATVLAPVLP